MEWARVGNGSDAVSGVSLELLDTLLIEASDLDGGRRTELETRLILGFYDRPEIRAAVAERLAAICGSLPAERSEAPA